jgi:UDPglucose 6-dehydrogenase
MGSRHGARQLLVESAIEINERQRAIVVEKLRTELGSFAGTEIAVLGLTFKPNTNDLRESPAIAICRTLRAAGARLRAFDPVAMVEAEAAIGDGGEGIRFPADVYEAVRGADAAMIMTEWNELRNLDLARIRSVMRRPVLVDARNVLDPSRTRALGYVHICTGRPTVNAGVAVS